jgi:hypothetical protein
MVVFFRADLLVDVKIGDRGRLRYGKRGTRGKYEEANDL